MARVKGPAQPPPAPARIWVLLASEASTAVIFRRGPSRWTRLYLWDTAADTLTPGSWFAGYLYALMSDLSPDGEHLVYYAHNSARRRQERASLELGVDDFRTWTAVCKPPWVKALGLWNARGCLFGGGGTFVDSRTLWLNHSVWSVELGETLRQPPGLNVVLYPESITQDIWTEALRRTGWDVLQLPESGYWITFDPPLVLRKKALELRVLHRRWSQDKLISEYLWHGPNPPDLSGVTWADLDQQGRLVYAREGRIYAQEAGSERELFDLNADQPPTSSRTLSP